MGSSSSAEEIYVHALWNSMVFYRLHRSRRSFLMMAFQHVRTANVIIIYYTRTPLSKRIRIYYYCSYKTSAAVLRDEKQLLRDFVLGYFVFFYFTTFCGSTWLNSHETTRRQCVYVYYEHCTGNDLKSASRKVQEELAIRS